MTQDRSVDERISAWLHEEAPDQLPDRVLQATFERTRPGRPQRARIELRPVAVPRPTQRAFAVGAAAILMVAVGVTLTPLSVLFGVAGPSAAPTATASAEPTLRPTPRLAPISLTGQIAFERTVDGNTDIYLMNLDRTGLVRLTDDPAPDVNPSWSPDGQHIVFRRAGGGASDLFVMNADGSDKKRLTESPGSEHDGRFSPDGTTIAFWGGSDAASELRLIDPDGSNDRLVIRFQDTFAAAGISWTGDGRAILFNRGFGRTNEIVRIELASKALTQITSRPEDDGRFALSNDGSTIAFKSDRLPAGIYLMDAEGSNVRHVTGALTTGYPASWSPDGDHLVYSQPDGWLYLVRTDGTEITRWAQGGLEVAWRPGS